MHFGYRINYARRNLNVLTGDELSNLLNNYALQNIAAGVALSKFVVYIESKRSQFCAERFYTGGRDIGAPFSGVS